MATAGIFGALGALGELGNQKATADQAAHEETVRRILEPLQVKNAQLGNAELVQRLAAGAQNLKSQQLQDQLARQPIPVGAPFRANGKTYQYVRDPLTGATTAKPVASPTPETPAEELYRSLLAIGIPDEEARSLVVQKTQGRQQTVSVAEPGADSPTGSWLVVKDKLTGQELWREPNTPQRGLQARETSSTTTNPYGLTTTHTSISRPILPGQPSGAPGGIVAPRRAFQSQEGAIAAQDGPFPQARSTAPSRPAASPVPSGQVGPYRGLDENHEIPATAPVNPLVREYANDLLHGRDANKIPQGARAIAEQVAKAYGWKGQGSLTPAQQMQIHNVSAALDDVRSKVGIFDNAPGRLFMATVPLDPSNEGGMHGLALAALRGALTAQQQQYLASLTRLRGMIAGIRGFTGANNSNATADRLLAELPTFTNTSNSADAADKLDKLQKELSIIKGLGYFLPDGDPRLEALYAQHPAAAQPARPATHHAADPLGLGITK